MNDQVFELDNFRGPLDLLLHLVREQEMEVVDVDLSRLCDQYLAAVAVMQAVDINLAGEFLVMASTLVLVKSRAILPREEEVDLEEELDPGDELIQQLLEYRKYKTLSLALDGRAEDRTKRLVRGAHEVPPDEENDLAEIDVWDLCVAYVRLMEEIGLRRTFHTLKNEKPLRVYLDEVVECLQGKEVATLRELIVRAGDGQDVFGYFLAVLELVKSMQVEVEQEPDSREILIRLRQERPALATVFGERVEATSEEARDPADPVAEASGGDRDDVVDDDTSDGLAASDPNDMVSPLAARPEEREGEQDTR
ncbi:MAG: segregation/condensation protein A [Planctomycetes bacterium]|nr:segregation/condensation protein A [Planctomycetota bacterium]